MSKTAEKTDPQLWEKVKHEVTEGDKGGKSGQWSARKAQLAVNEYKHEGGGYRGKKTSDNHLVQWGEEDWGTKSGRKSEETGERYLPRKAREALTKEEYARTTRKKRNDTRAGHQHSAQPADVAAKTAPYREGHDAPTGKAAGAGGETRAALYARAREAEIPGRSGMTKAQLASALARAGR